MRKRSWKFRAFWLGGLLFRLMAIVIFGVIFLVAAVMEKLSGEEAR